MPGIIDDRRKPGEEERTIGFVVATDSFFSNSSFTAGKSIFAMPFEDRDQVDLIEKRMKERNEMKRVRTVGPKYRPALKDGDHLSIRSFSEAADFLS